MSRLLNMLEGLCCEVVFQWVPGHCGLEGNDQADRAAKEATALQRADAERVPVTYQAAKALILREVRGRPPEHVRTRQVYTCRTGDSGHPRRTGVLLAQLRSGHCMALASYRAKVGRGISPTCPK